jgi:hypothetical protein
MTTCKGAFKPNLQAKKNYNLGSNEDSLKSTKRYDPTNDRYYKV